MGAMPYFSTGILCDFQRVSPVLTEVYSVATDVTGKKNSRAHAAAVGLSFSSDVHSSTVVWARPNYWKASGVVYSVSEAERLERGEALVVVHRKDTVELTVRPGAEESVCRVRTVDLHPFAGEVADYRLNDLLFFVSHQAVVAGMRIETQYGDAG